MSKKNKHQQHEQQNDDVVSMIPGASHIDIGEIRRAQQNQDADFSDDEEMDAAERSLDDEAALIMNELENDDVLKTDVLADFNADESNDQLDKIAEGVAKQTAEDIAGYEQLAAAVSDELVATNIDMIKEDILLESTIAQELAAEQMTEAKSKTKKSKKSKKSETTEETIVGASSDSVVEELSASSDSENTDDVETEEMSEQDLELRAALPQMNDDGEYNLDDLQSCISALLFYSEKPLSLKKMKEMLEMPDAEDTLLLSAINALRDEFTKSAHGFEIAEIAGGYQYRTKIARAPLLRKLAKVQVQRLSRGAMEALTIVAFKQPCTKDDIDQVRGVDSSHFIRTLLDRNLIEVTGRSEAAGRPMIYGTTNTFLEVFGMMDLSGLPSLREIEEAVPQLAAQEEGQEDPRVIQMRKMVHQMKEDSNHLDYNAKEDDEILAEIRDRVKSIDVTTPYLARQKELAEEGIHGADADEILAKEFGFTRDPNAPVEVQAELTLATEEHIAPLTVDNSMEEMSLETMELEDFKVEGHDDHSLVKEASLSAEESSEMNHVREALENLDLDSDAEHS